MRSLKSEAPLVIPFEVDPTIADQDGYGDVDSYEGWLPTEDDADVPDEDTGPVHLESFIRLCLEASKRKRRKRKKPRPLAWYIGGPISTGPGNPGFGSSGGGCG